MQTLSISRLYKENIPVTKKKQSDRSHDLENLLTALIICKEAYNVLARSTRWLGLKEVCNLFSAERADYAFKLYRDLGLHGGLSVEHNDHIVNSDDYSWISLPQSAGKGDAAILNTIIASESAALKNYETYLSNNIPIIKHLQMLTGQIQAIKQAMKALSELSAVIATT